jgi:hypothetical protein
MTRTTKIVMIVSAILGFSAGITGGVTTALKMTDTMQSLYVTVLPGSLFEFSSIQFHRADAAHARDAVSFEIYTLGQLQSVLPQYASQGALAFAFARLAIIEETAGNALAAQAAFEQARAYEKKLHPDKDITDEQLRHAVRLRDEGLEKYHLPL